MSFGGFLENKPGGGGGNGGGGGGRIVADIPYANGSNHNHNNINIISSNDITTTTMPSGAISQARLASPTLAKSMFNNSPGLSLALQTNIDGQVGDIVNNNRLVAENFEGNNGLRRSREEEHESRSGSDNMDGVSGDDLDAADNNPPRKKRYHRHTPQQIQELEAYNNILSLKK